MSVLTLLNNLIARGVVMGMDEEGFLVNAPAGVLTDADRQALKEHKPELIELLSTPALQEHPDRVFDKGLWRRGPFVEYTTATRPAYIALRNKTRRNTPVPEQSAVSEPTISRRTRCY
jgi:hypothetical protein